MINSNELQVRLTDILDTFESLPASERRKLDELSGKTSSKPVNTKKTYYEKVVESFDYIRLSIKYIMFDNEALRRENRVLRKLLEEQK